MDEVARATDDEGFPLLPNGGHDTREGLWAIGVNPGLAGSDQHDA